MEDEDGESKNMDMWNILDEQRIKESILGNSLKHSDDEYMDLIEGEGQLLRYNPFSAKNREPPNKNTITGPRFAFKGFKKRILDQAREIHAIAARRNSALEQQQSAATHTNASGRQSSRYKRTAGKRSRKITEYAQYLGLQPSSRYRCSKCHGWSNCGPNSKRNLCVCNPPTMTPIPGTSESSSLPHVASNLKITRKVYLCAACGTYFENWNLFLHMRDIHKRHICLFCLGMFGQVDRLSHHLAKKHNVPEMVFDSAKEFYDVFQESCYLVCCTCEKVFSETDNFYEHLCTPALKQDTTAGVSMCTLCRQIGAHASTCNFALLSDNKDKELYAPTIHADVASPVVVPSPDRTANLGGKGLPRKAVKNNRSKYGGDAIVQNALEQRSNATLTRKFGPKGRSNEARLHRESDVQKEVTNNVPRDTVSETIMEVSRYIGDSSDENNENDEQAMNKDAKDRDRGPREKSPIHNHQLERNEPYDSVTATIMEVSRCMSDMEEETNEKEENSSTCVPNALHMGEKMGNEENEKTGDGSVTDPTCQLASPRAASPIRWEAEEIATVDKRTTCEFGTEFESQSFDSLQNARSRSPVGRSLFSPRHESHVLELQSKEKEHFEGDREDEEEEEGGEEEEEEEEEEERSVARSVGESQVLFNAVASSDRSLVIKICNRNSQFSVATATTVPSRESEENNNAAESSTSKERIMNDSESREGNIVVNDIDRVIDLDESDSDSDKLAVVDNNPEEDEEAENDEEGEQTNEIAGTENRRGEDAIVIENSENNEIETKKFTVVVGSSDATEEKQLDSGTGGAEIVANDVETKTDGGIVLAGEDVPCVDLNVEGTLDSMELEELLRRCIEAASPICVYCNHARHIAVNGKQLGLHMLAEHKFQPQHPAIIIHAEQFTVRVKRSLDELESRYFNLSTYNSTDGTYNVPAVRTYECFHCRFHSAVHKELYLHNRKMHQKTILICIMCKSTFYSYSELLCHLCPGIYSPNINVRYRCCLCAVASLPSAFRLMVHLRKRHHACDVCLESTGNQQRLSNHVWKHKLHHLCYRCGIAYRNKPDITKHLFWKHGTESVLCKKCLQKKWPHIYHFCIPPTAFVCEECGSNFGRAVALKVHKRLHSGDLPYGCDECGEHFISRKLLAKHQVTHREPEPLEVDVDVVNVVERLPADGSDEKLDRDKIQRITTSAVDSATTATAITTESVQDVKETVKRVVDVYDLPPLNLSSESDTDSEEEKTVSMDKEIEKEKTTMEDGTGKNQTTEEIAKDKENGDDDEDYVITPVNDIVDVEQNEEEKKQEARIMDGIWDNFKTYAASLEIKESTESFALKESAPETNDLVFLKSIVLADHDYCVVSSEKNGDQIVTPKNDDDDTKIIATEQETKVHKSPSPGSPNRNIESDANKRTKAKTPKKKKRSASTSSSDSSSDTDSSSCSCGTNCSCSSSSSGSSSSSSSSSDSDSSTSESSPRKQSNRKDRSKKEKEIVRENKSASVEPENKEEIITMENGLTVPEETVPEPVLPAKPLLCESDLETEETDTDEDFYDEHPQLLANKLLENRNQLLLLAAVSTAPVSTLAATATVTMTTIATATTTTTTMSAMSIQASMDQTSIPLNNGIADIETLMSEPMAMTTIENRPQQKKRTKTKKRRKGERGKRNVIAVQPAVESIKLNIPKAYYQKNLGFTTSSPAVLSTLHLGTLPAGRSSTPTASTCNNFHGISGVSDGNSVSITAMEMPLQTASTAVAAVPAQNIGGNGSETENKRSSKRKRVPKRFYGDSSDDEPQEKHQIVKWGRKIEITPAFAPPPPPPVTMPAPVSPMMNPKPISSSKLSFGGKIVQTCKPVYAETGHHQTLPLPSTQVPVVSASATESEGAAESSSDSSESDVENTMSRPRVYGESAASLANDAPTSDRPAKIYCYCRCPYDEVSEMIACDGEDCRIEWFHFECVGIMVPPKGKWYCPDCRRKHGIVQNNDEYCD